MLQDQQMCIKRLKGAREKETHLPYATRIICDNEFFENKIVRLDVIYISIRIYAASIC